MSPLPAHSSKRLIGQTLADRYQVIEALSAGGMGMLYTARHVWTRREVALKVIQPGLLSDASVSARFLREAQSAAQLDHPNVVDVLDMGRTEDGLVFMVLEMLEGETLKQRMRRGPMGAREAVQLLEPIMDALVYVHERQLVHRDIKPSNIFLAKTPRQGVVPKLLDFGLVKILDDAKAGAAKGAGVRSLSSSSFDTSAKKQVTRKGYFLGSPFYMAPEQARGEASIGPAADVWSMGVVLYEALTGKRPFQTTDPVVAVGAVASEPPIPIGQVGDGLPPAVCEWIDHALSQDPASRPPMAAFVAGLLAATGVSASSPGRTRSPVARKRPAGDHVSTLTEAPTTIAAKRRAPATQSSEPDTVVAGDPTLLNPHGAIEPLATNTELDPASGARVGPPLEPPAERRRAVLAVGMLVALVAGAGALWFATRPATATNDAAAAPPPLAESTRTTGTRVDPEPPEQPVDERPAEAANEEPADEVVEPAAEEAEVEVEVEAEAEAEMEPAPARQRSRERPTMRSSNPLEIGL